MPLYLREGDGNGLGPRTSVAAAGAAYPASVLVVIPGGFLSRPAPTTKTVERRTITASGGCYACATHRRRASDPQGRT